MNFPGIKIQIEYSKMIIITRSENESLSVFFPKNLLNVGIQHTPIFWN